MVVVTAGPTGGGRLHVLGGGGAAIDPVPDFAGRLGLSRGAADRDRRRARSRWAASAWSCAGARPAPPLRDVYPVPQAARPRRLPAVRRRVAGRVVLVDGVRLVPTLPPKLQALESTDVVTCEVEPRRGDLHRRYEIAAVPTTVVAEHEGVVRRAFVGAFTATDLWAAVAELPPGSTPSPTSANARAAARGDGARAAQELTAGAGGGRVVARPSG